jgi:hypothetical protein
LKEKIILLLSVFSLLYSDLHTQNFKNIQWKEIDKNEKIEIEEFKLYGYFSNYYVEYFKTDEGIKKFNSHHFKTKVSESNTDFSKEIVIENYNSSKIIDLRMRIYRGDTILKFNSEQISKKIDSQKTDNDYLYYKIDEISPGDIIEVIYTLEKYMDFEGFQYIQQSYPIKSSYFTLIHNDFEPITKVYNSEKYLEKDTLINNYKSKYIQFSDLDKTKYEQYSKPIANKVRVAYQLFPNKNQIITNSEFWNNIVKNLGDYLMPKGKNLLISKICDSIKNQKVLDNKNLDFQYSVSIDNYIKENITINNSNSANLQSIDSILKFKEATDYSIIKLYTNMLSELDVDYEIVLSSNKYYQNFDRYFFSQNQLRIFLIFLPKLNKYIVPEGKQHTVSEAPTYLLGNDAIFIDQNLNFYFSQIILSNSDFSSINKIIDIKINSRSRSTKIKETREYYGYWSKINREYINIVGSENDELIKEILTITGLKNKKIINYKANNFELRKFNDNVPLKIISELETDELITKNEDNSLNFKIGKVIGVQSDLFDEKTRQNPIEIEFPNSYTYSINLKIPKGYKILDEYKLNYEKKYIGNDGSITALFKSSSIRNKNILEIKISEYYNKLTYNKLRYNEFRDVINSAASFYETSINLIKN